MSTQQNTTNQLTLPPSLSRNRFTPAQNSNQAIEAQRRQTHYLISLVRDYDFSSRNPQYSRNIFPYGRICSLDTRFYEARNDSDAYFDGKETNPLTQKEYTAWAQWKEIVDISSVSGMGFLGLHALTGVSEMTVFLIEKTLLPINPNLEVATLEIPDMRTEDLYASVYNRVKNERGEWDMPKIKTALGASASQELINLTKRVADDILTALLRVKETLRARIQSSESEMTNAAAGRNGKVRLDPADWLAYDRLGINPRIDPEDLNMRIHQKRNQKRVETVSAEETEVIVRVKCLACSERIVEGAAVCRFCGLVDPTNKASFDAELEARIAKSATNKKLSGKDKNDGTA